ncbi:MAG: nucleotide sugar dehydrogenase [Gammaproteobacteria bacterium]|nr:nucleotide sugar dehydrogenase [Gammaproteobacteria bacterium]
MFPHHPKIAILGLGYVGLPLAVAFGSRFQTVGYDINPTRIAALQQGRDESCELLPEELAAARELTFTTETAPFAGFDIFIITVPTPVNHFKHPDLTPLLSATATAADSLTRGGIVIYESTVYPGATEEECVPLLERRSTLRYNRDFFVGYSPERVNPGDKTHRVTNIVKITSGSTPEVADYVDWLYNTIVTVGTHRASSIRVAEAAKVIENTQRDVNIALINELALLFNRLGIDTLEVLEAAGTKWNFLPFRPGLVGGHCIGVDPYYLTHKARAVNYTPEMILAGRRLNDAMGGYIAVELIKLLSRRGVTIAHCKVLILGITFKEDCTDIRNSRVVDIVHELQSFAADISVYDPHADRDETLREYDITLCQQLQPNHYHAVIVAVAHRQFVEMGVEALRGLLLPDGILYDLKSVFAKDAVDGRL